MLRTFDPAPFNQIAAHPEVLPWLGLPPGAEPDLSALVRDPRNFAFLTGNRDGGYVLKLLQPGLYEAHTLAIPSARGAPMGRLLRDGFYMMFTASEAIEVVTSIPDGNAAALDWSTFAGFRDTFRSEAKGPGAIHLMGEMVGQQHRSIRYEDWVAKSRDAETLGKLFHAKLDEARGEPSHQPDRLHDRWVGATMACAIAGNLGKGIGLYNRWALQANYAEARILSFTPPLVDIGDAIVQLQSGALDVLEIKPRSGEPLSA